MRYELDPRKRLLTSATFKTRTAVRFSLAHLLSDRLPLYIVNGYPKSGTTWVSQLLADALGLPYQSNRIPVPKPSILHSHYLHRGNMKNVVVVWRDGRDTLLSWYYHCLFPNDLGGNRLLVEKVRNDLRFADYQDVRANLPRFLEYSFTKQSSPRFSWADFVRSWHPQPRAVHVHYEDLKTSGEVELGKIVKGLTGDELGAERAETIVRKFSFPQQVKDKPEHGDVSFLRKGITGDWINYYNLEARRVFDHYAGEELILLGYESDSSWVDFGDSEA